MSDIVERLRLSVTKGHEPTDEDAIEARVEIETLRKAADADGFHRVLAARDAEIERQRAALQRIAAIKQIAPRPWSELNDGPIIARNALAKDTAT